MVTLPHRESNKRGNRNMTELREGTKVALYARVSTDDRKGIQAQLDRMRRQAEEDGLEPVSHFTDMNGSREEFDWMMAQATSENPPVPVDPGLRHQPVLAVRAGLEKVDGGTGGERCAGNLHQGTSRQRPSVGTKRTITPCKHGPGICRALSISGDLHGLTAPTMAQTPTAPSPRESQ